jgi:serine/threonine-protein kinase
VLVTRLPDRRALARLLRAALRHEIAQVALTEAPRPGTHTLDLRVPGSPPVSLLAEAAGAPVNGQFPLRLRPLHRAQAAELYALLEAENPSSEASVETAPPGSPQPDTVAQPRTISYEDSGPILRAMSGSAPPPAAEIAMPRAPSPIDPRVTARMDWPPPATRPAVVDPSVRRTSPSASWSAQLPPSTTKEESRAWSSHPSPMPSMPAQLPDDPRRTARSASWAPPPEEPPPTAQSAAPSLVLDFDDGDGSAADDPSLSVSVVFEPDMLPAAVAAATAAALAEAKGLSAPQQPEEEAPWESSPADDEGPSLSVSVIFEPDALMAERLAALQRAEDAPTDADAELASVDVPLSEPQPFTPTLAMVDGRIANATGSVTGEEPTEPKADGLAVPHEITQLSAQDDDGGAGAGGAGDFFFDEDFANLAMAPADVDDSSVVHRASEAPATEGGPPIFTPRASQLGAMIPEEVESADGPVPWPDDDDDADTLIRLPNAPSGNMPVGREVRSAPVPAAGMPPRADARTVSVPPPAPPPKPTPSPMQSIVSSHAHAREELTPTQSTLVVASKSTTGGGRKKKSTRNPKGSQTGGEKKKKQTKHPADGEAETGVAFQQDEVPTGRKSKVPSVAPPAETEADRDPLIGRKIADGKYTIEAAIGSGAAGAVYKATHRELRRTVAIKVLHPHYQQDPHFMKSFRGEALAASQLDHPNVMRVLDFGQEPNGLVYIVMEYLSGRTLQSLLDEERRLQTDRAVEIMIQVCAALSVAHDNGIIHRDIKPDNIVLVASRNDEGGTFELVKVCDFGIAALQNPTREDAEMSMGLIDNVIAGTPEYMSPEQARGVEIDARSDVYAAGICLYELVTGRPPFLGENAAEILIKQIEEQPRPPSQLIKGLDSIVEEIILRAIHKEPAKRPQSAREMRVELKEIIDPGDASHPGDEDERSIVENVPVLDDPASGFPGFFIAFSSSILRFGRFERGHPEASQAMKELLKATKAALRGRREVTFARRDSAKALGFCVMTGHGEIVELRRLLGSQLYGSFGEPFVDAVVKKGIAALTLREGLPDVELQYMIEMLLGPHENEELRKELLGKPLRHLSVLFVADVVGRDRKLSWKVGLCAARLARDLRALSNVRGISLKKMREIREDLVTSVAHLLTKGDEVRQFLFNADLVDEAVANLRGFSGFKVAPLVFERLLHEPCAEAVTLLLEDYDKGAIDPDVIKGYLRAFATRLLGERSPRSDAAVAELYRRSIVTDADVPRDLQEQIRAASLAEALIREPSQFLRTLDFIQNPDDYGRELGTLEAAMAVLARRAEAGALLAAIGVLARHAKSGKPGPRENHALRTMKSMIDKQRLVPIANALLVGPPHQREPARQLLVLAGSAGVHALYVAREGLTDMSARPVFVQVFRETGAAGWSLLSAVLPRMEVQNDTDIAFVEDLLRSMPDRQDPALGDAVAKFLAHPRLRPAALAAIVPLWGERARKPLMDALEFAEEPARIVAVTELRRIRGIDEQAVGVIERFLTMKGSASEELRVASAAALADVVQPMRTRAIALLSKGVENKRGFVAMLRGNDTSDESVLVTEAMARALLALDRTEGMRAVKARLGKSDGILRSRLTALLQQAP